MGTNISSPPGSRSQQRMFEPLKEPHSTYIDPNHTVEGKRKSRGVRPTRYSKGEPEYYFHEPLPLPPKRIRTVPPSLGGTRQHSASISSTSSSLTDTSALPCTSEDELDFLHGATNLQSVRNNNKFEEDNLHQETQNNGDIMSVPSTIYPMSIDFDIVAVRKENRLLREQVSQLQLYRSNETTFLQGEVRRLNAYIDKLNRLHDPDTQTLSRSSDKDELEKDIEIAGLKTQLDQAQKMSRLLLEVDVNSTMGYLPHAPKEMNQIKSSIHHTANILQQHISLDDQQLEQISESEELDRLVCENIGDKNILGEATTQALRALIFAFVRHRVFESKETFYDLHFDGFMTREYQKTLAACSSSEFVERYHRVTLSQLFTRSSDLESNEFEKCFIPPVVEELRLEIMCLLSPLIRDDSESKNLNRWWRKLFEDALRFRVRCYPPAGTRYEIVQYKPGDFFDPEVMEVHDAAGIPVHMADDGEKHHVKLCMHGLIKSYTVDEVSSGIDLIKELSQPFYPEGVRHGGKDGETITSKAIVMLE